MIANGWLKETSTNIKVAAKNSSDCKNTTLRAQQPKSTYLKTCNNYHTKTLQGRLRLPCPAQFKNRKTVSHNAVRRKNRLTEKTHASGKTKKCLSWHPSQWRMGRFGGTVESFWRQAVVFWAWEGLKRLIQWSAEVPGVHVTLELPSCWLSCCHWDCYSLFILIQIAKPWQNQMQKHAESECHARGALMWPMEWVQISVHQSIGVWWVQSSQILSSP